MRSSGHYSHPPDALETTLAAFSEGGARPESRESAPLVPAPRRLANRELQLAVVRALGGAGRPLRVAEVCRAAERELHKPVSRSSVNACLSVGARPSGRFERVARGLYRLGRES